MSTRTAYLWWCGDPVCDCTQPIVEEIRPNPACGGHKWVTRTRLGEGTFYSQATEEELAQQYQELEELAWQWGVPADGTPVEKP